MPEQVIIGHKRVRVGDKVRSKERAAENGICNQGMVFSVAVIKKDGDLLIGLSSPRCIKGWGDLDGHVQHRQGFWATRDCLLDNFELICNDHEITGDESFKGRQLKGMRCKVLHVDRRTSSVFVELPEDVGGGSADGAGRRGHCVVVNARSLTKRKQQEDSTEEWIEEDRYA